MECPGRPLVVLQPGGKRHRQNQRAPRRSRAHRRTHSHRRRALASQLETPSVCNGSREGSATVRMSSTVRGEGPAGNLHRALTTLRAELEKMDGSLAVLHRPANMQAFDAWGSPGDSLPLLKAVKTRLDPWSTLNPGRFVGGI